jgi:hypothetical protein
MTPEKEAYWKARQDEKAFREFFWEWRTMCRQQFGSHFVKTNMHMFTQRAFRSYIEIYDTIDDARTAIFKPVERVVGEEEDLELLGIKTTVDTSE